MDVYLDSRGQGFGPEVKRRVMVGTYALSAGYRDAYYIRAQKVRTKIKEEMDKELEKVDCLLTPSTPHIAFKIGEQSDDPVQMYLEDILAGGASLAGLPAISVPGGFIDDMPIGAQVIGGRFNESMVFRVAAAIERELKAGERKPNI
jgi:aspartyl-tRNA(Asn)/glutamyl-tRNA(Gln) amidotransferase subunit A